MRIGIIGSAGRGEDGKKLTKELWEKAGFLYEGVGVGVGEIKVQ